MRRVGGRDEEEGKEDEVEEPRRGLFEGRSEVGGGRNSVVSSMFREMVCELERKN